jgi:hypothetical protein
MRRAYQDYGFIIENDKFIGVSLGFDFCAEHECGISRLKDEFGLPLKKIKKNLGIKSRKINEVPDSLKFRKDSNKTAVMWIANWFSDELPPDLEDYEEKIKSTLETDRKFSEDWKKRHGSEYHSSSKEPMISAWDDKSFGIAVYGEKETQWLQELYNKIKKKNVAIASLNISGDNPFANASLSIVIVNRLPQYALDALYTADKKYFDLHEYEKKIGMKKIKEKQGKKNGYKGENFYLACSPSWINYEDKEERNKKKKKMGTKYDIWYWINYSDDDDNYGWYTVEEIKKWLTTKGLKLTDIRKG